MQRKSESLNELTFFEELKQIYKAKSFITCDNRSFYTDDTFDFSQTQGKTILNLNDVLLLFTQVPLIYYHDLQLDYRPPWCGAFLISCSWEY